MTDFAWCQCGEMLNEDGDCPKCDGLHGRKCDCADCSTSDWESADLNCGMPSRS